MLSILIPIFNCNVVELVKQLNEQCLALKINYQILCFDDYSIPEIKAMNAQIAELTNVGYIELSENCGRSRIRNKLAKMARFDNLVFMDCDSKLLNNMFIENYCRTFETHKVVYGGRIYENKSPEFEYLLHWNYGRKVESIDVSERQKNPWLTFRSNNFYIHSSVFNSVKFDENINQYGHEDTLFAAQLKEAGHSILHIENAVIHNGLEKNEVFLDKTVSGIENLAYLINSKRISEPRIIKLYHALKSWGVLGICETIGNKYENAIKNIIIKHPTWLKLFQMWKLLVFIRQMKKPA